MAIRQVAALSAAAVIEILICGAATGWTSLLLVVRLEAAPCDQACALYLNWIYLANVITRLVLMPIQGYCADRFSIAFTLGVNALITTVGYILFGITTVDARIAGFALIGLGSNGVHLTLQRHTDALSLERNGRQSLWYS